ncbi:MULTISPECIES: GAF domain-containing protein [Leptolyngbya]|uniref:GAF domain-containing protein n=1 Tax=Leptolyngbya TaxID=47251 RepID=UPI001681F3D9|nr:GAF domain-containing protein [Leptolyngbya sp. FACHB-1624]MBD1859034.1 GAF domain-containing protein [Leptolyngbya sp. FACHB-1624]
MPPEIDQLLSQGDLSELMRAIAEYFNCDRCFFYLRNPQTRLGRVPFCWTRNSQIPIVYDEDWKPEPQSLPDEDPMFAAALSTKPSIFVEDVQTASAQVLNADFERENFGHRALIHGHICDDNQLWGVLQPCMMHRPRPWTAAEREIFTELIQRITPIAVAYIRQHSEYPPEE